MLNSSNDFRRMQCNLIVSVDTNLILMSTDFKKRSSKLLDSASKKQLNGDMLCKDLVELFKTSPGAEELSNLLCELAKNYPALVKDINKASQLTFLIDNTPIDYLGYLCEYLRTDISRSKGIEKRIIQFDYSFNADYQMIVSSRPKTLSLQNVTSKIELLYPILKTYKKRLNTHEAMRWIGFITLDTSSRGKMFNELVKQLSEEVANIKWEVVVELLQEGVPTRGNYGVMMGLIDKNHREIAEGFYRAAKTSKSLVMCLQALLSDAIPPGTLKVVAIITKSEFTHSKPTFIFEYFEKILKPILLPNLKTSKFFKSIEDVVKVILIKKFQISESFLEESDIIPHDLHKSYPVEHLTLLIDLTSCWTKESCHSSIINKLHRLMPKEVSLKTRGDERREKTQSSLYTSPKTELRMQHSDLNDKVKSPPPASSKKKPEERTSQDTDRHKVIMFECGDFVGLPNVGNSCYINSFIQNLLFCQDFMTTLSNTNLDKHRPLQLLKKILLKLSSKDSSKLKEDLLEFKKQLPALFSIDSTQQDSMQFGRQLINAMISAPQLNRKVSDIFLTKTKMMTRCPDGDVSSVIEEMSTEMILTFEHPTLVSKMNSDSVIRPVKMEDLLNDYFADNTIEGEFKCDKCKRKFDRCKRSIELVELPSTLIIVLSRFTYDINLQKKRKILDVVPLQDYLHLGNIKNIKGIGKASKQYKLTSFVVHLGNQAESGHYQVYVRHPVEEQFWVVFDDDNSVMQVNCENAKTLARNLAIEETPYIMFYTRM